ncbi:hypothetical protein [Absidia glauca]|uniref:Uncharacterized protein n=1 Tax=Absidia glauca TaxID=4829 RepID=A0A163JH41_ABSGL|nr:hypothetical protein [Absidia glauca]
MGNHISKTRKRIKKRTTSVKSGQPPPSSFTTTQSTISDSTDGHAGDTKFDQARYDADQIQELHYLIKHVFQRNLLSPAADVLSVPGAQCLDIGCGPTATWLIGKPQTLHMIDLTLSLSLSLSR